MSRKRKALSAGDVFASQLPDGRYAAVRILRVCGRSALVSTCAYLGDKPPVIDDVLLRQTVIQNRFRYRGAPARCWHMGLPTARFIPIGTIPPSPEESALECPVYGGKWDDHVGDEAFLEWRWIHDRPAFEEEIRRRNEDLEHHRRLPQKPKKMMDEAEFWWILNYLDWGQEGDDQKVLAPAIRALASKSAKDICRFEERLAFLLYQIDTKAHASNTGEYAYGGTCFSDDGFLYARCVVVANGRLFYETVLHDPTQMPKDLEFEALLYLARSAFELKTGKDFEHLTGCSYETGSNYAGWKSV